MEDDNSTIEVHAMRPNDPQTPRPTRTGKSTTKARTAKATREVEWDLDSIPPALSREDKTEREGALRELTRQVQQIKRAQEETTRWYAEQAKVNHE